MVAWTGVFAPLQKKISTLVVVVFVSRNCRQRQFYLCAPSGSIRTRLLQLPTHASFPRETTKPRVGRLSTAAAYLAEISRWPSMPVDPPCYIAKIPSGITMGLWRRFLRKWSGSAQLSWSCLDSPLPWPASVQGMCEILTRFMRSESGKLAAKTRERESHPKTFGDDHEEQE